MQCDNKSFTVTFIKDDEYFCRADIVRALKRGGYRVNEYEPLQRGQPTVWMLIPITNGSEESDYKAE